MSNNTILIVDDDPEILAFYRKLFAPATSSEFDVLASPDQEQAGLECLTYSDPLQLLEYYRISVADGRQHPLCIVDMRMPILNGLATATRLREIDPDIDIVICTAFSDVPVEKIRAQIKSGIFIVRKPFVTDEFILLVQSLTGYWHTRKNLAKTQTELSNRTALLGSLLESIPDLVFMKNAAGVYLNCNQAFSKFVGLPSEHIIGHTDFQLFPPEVAAEFREVDQRVMEGRVPCTFEESIEYPDKRQVLVETVKMPIIATDSSCIGIIGVARDITRRAKEARELTEAKLQAEEASQAKSSFLAMMSHEIRTPLNGVLGFASLLLETPLSESQRELAHWVKKSSDVLLTVINEVLDFSKIEAKKITLEEATFEIKDAVEESIALIAVTATDKAISIRSEISPETPERIVGDVTRFRQVLINLLGNAVKFTTDGEVSVSIFPDPEASAATPMLRIEVIDSGIGMSQEQRDRLFQPFMQADSSTTRRFGGTGLGLTISKRLVELMGGRIWVAPATDRRGSVFIFTLPIRLPENLSETRRAISPCTEFHSTTEPDPADSSNLNIARPLRILLAEDNPVNQKVCLMRLAKFGYAADVAGNGIEAVEAVISRPYDVVLMDIQMPEMDGLEATRVIRSSSVNTRQPWIIALTAQALDSDRLRCQAAGMNDYLSKPFRHELLLEALRQAYNAKSTGQNPAATKL